MMTVIWTFLKNPKNLIITALAVCFLACMAVVLIQRVTISTKTAKIETQAKDIERFKAAQAAYQKTVDDYAGQVIKWRKMAESQQAVTNQTAKEVVKIKYVKNKCTMEGDDAKIINGMFDYYNSAGRMR